jgi:hypothetical protein
MSDATANRFVIQHHTGYGPEHWDLMLEDGDTLATWQLSRPPTPGDAGPIEAIRIADHRKAYLTYEGPVSGSRGQVTIHEAGTYATCERGGDSWTFQLQGRQLNGLFMLRRVAKSPDRGERWEFLCHEERLWEASLRPI